jgi:hypothetical protein
MTIVQRTADLPRKFPRDSFSQPSMGDNIIQHHRVMYKLKDHGIVLMVDGHLSHLTNVRMMKQRRQNGFAEDADVFAPILRFEPRDRFQAVPIRVVFVHSSVDSGYPFDHKLYMT